ncbi:hypothetical protein B0H10DRAFT_2032377 [Mycena sp. CBHHK59/15]|nr:hypothetical protein B0H10DRAFT_2032377 [Mycena sp. CBHHK59/15]
MTSGFLDLPSEILAIILENPNFPDNTLYSLALLCRRLHFIALPIYFSRNGMDYQSKSVVIAMRADGRDMLAALHTALFVSSMEKITCIFPHPSCTSIFPLLYHLQRVKGLVWRFPSVKEVILQLDVRGSICLSVGDDEALRAWASNLGDLLNCIVDRKCSSLTVRYGGQLTKAFEVFLPQVLRTVPRKSIRDLLARVGRLISPLKRRISQDPTWVFRRVFQQGDDPVMVSMPPDLCSSDLTSLHIQSAILILPPCLHWTLTALRQCSITSLTLSEIYLDTDAWSIVLKLIAETAPTLTSVSLIELRSISDLDIVTFCSRLKLLENLEIDTKNFSPPNPLGFEYGSMPEFQHLSRLRAPSEFILYFLRCHNSLPGIQSLCLSCPTVQTHHTSLDIHSLSRRLSLIIRTLGEHCLNPTLSLSLNSMFYHLVSPDITTELSDDLHMSLDRILGLEITILPFFFADIADMAGWIRVFRRVQCVRITLESPLDTTAHAERLVEAIQPMQFLEMVEVNGKSYSLKTSSGAMKMS